MNRIAWPEMSALAKSISVPRIVLLSLFGSSAFICGMAYQAYVDRQMPTVIIKPQNMPVEPLPPKRQTLT